MTTNLHDYECQVDGCEADAAALIVTDDDEAVILCQQHRDEATTGVVTVKRRDLLCDTAGTWGFMPEKGIRRG